MQDARPTGPSTQGIRHMLRRLRICISTLALLAAAGGAHASTVFSQSFDKGLGAQEALHGGFKVADGAVGHGGPYGANEHSWYEVNLDLTKYASAVMTFDWTMSTERGWDGWNLTGGVDGVFGSNALIIGQNTPFNDAVRIIGAAASGVGAATSRVDLTRFAGKNVKLRWSFASDASIQGLGVKFDNISVTGEALAPTPGVPEPTTWAMMIGGFGLVGASLRRREARRAA